jgi:excisionase family DNA binding protein
MSDVEPEDVDPDPWLTVAEIADELRVNPATVRLWVSKGTLPATRAGQRKLLIRRSDLDRMLESIRPEPTGFGNRPPRSTHPRYRDRPPVLQSMRQLSTADIHGYRLSPAEMQGLVEQLQVADDLWDIAQAASDDPPPDLGFPQRVRSLARACEHEASALGRATSVHGFSWTPLPDHRHMIISHELRPGANRPGPPKLWQEFDRAVQRLGIAMEGRIMHAVALQYPRSRNGHARDRRPAARRDSRDAGTAGMIRRARSETRSAIRGIGRSRLRTTGDRRPPRRCGDQVIPGPLCSS